MQVNECALYLLLPLSSLPLPSPLSSSSSSLLLLLLLLVSLLSSSSSLFELHLLVYASE